MSKHRTRVYETGGLTAGVKTWQARCSDCSWEGDEHDVPTNGNHWSPAMHEARRQARADGRAHVESGRSVGTLRTIGY